MHSQRFRASFCFCVCICRTAYTGPPSITKLQYPMICLTILVYTSKVVLLSEDNLIRFSCFIQALTRSILFLRCTEKLRCWSIVTLRYR